MRAAHRLCLRVLGLCGRGTAALVSGKQVRRRVWHVVSCVRHAGLLLRLCLLLAWFGSMRVCRSTRCFFLLPTACCSLARLTGWFWWFIHSMPA